MPDRVTTSFIPKEALQTSRSGSPLSAQQGPFVIINIVATFILVSALIASGGFYVADQYSSNLRKEKEQQLANARAAFEPESIRALDQLSKRIRGAQGLLQTHVAPSLILEDLERRTQQNLRFKDLVLTRDILQPNYKIVMNGESISLNTIALQAGSFATSTIIKDPLFSGVNTTENGNVIFSFTANIPKDRITYAERVEKERGTTSTVPLEDGANPNPLQ